METYLSVIEGTSVEALYKIPHLQLGAYPTGFVVIHKEPLIIDFSFTICPLYTCSANETNLNININIPGKNSHDVIINYSSEMGSLEKLLYTLYETYKETSCEKTETSKKRYVYAKKLPPRKIIIPCFKRKENLLCILKRFSMIKEPIEGYKPQILLVEHSPMPEFKGVAEENHCEYIWLYLNPQIPHMPLGQFNKALCYDKAFLSASPAQWYLFHDNDVIVPFDFWNMLDKNVERSKAQFLQPFAHRCLFNLKQAVADVFREDISMADLPLDGTMHTPLSPGAPGGSLYISRERYLQAGGHDPQFCWGYGPEDAMFYHKLEQIEPIAFGDDPAIEMFHLWHPPAASANPFRKEMDWFVKVLFKGKPKEEKLAYMKYKEAMLKNLMQNPL